MRKLTLLLATVVLLSSCTHELAKNPDPNHTHADFAVWIDGTQLDFSDAKYMSGTVNGVEKDLDEYFHLHDGNGHVLHMHKPGLPVSEFFTSIKVTMAPNCMKFPQGDSVCNSTSKKWQLFVNGKEHAFDPSFSFSDGDKLLFTYGADATELQKEESLMTDDACLYSLTCPWRGTAPTEHCIADPTVPCRE